MVSHYRILGRLGGGGMGVVYKAEDTRLLRPVALKFLAPAYASAPEALARFQREARAASALNHPNICTVYDVGEQEGHAFIAMELLEGVTLAERVAAAPFDWGTLLRVSTEVLDALEAAHAAGIVHRDIKPANLFVTSRGHAKILDFGVAKVHPLARDGAVDLTKTAPADLTLFGSAVGTLSHMAPEQVSGQPVDARADLFSFGVVLCEMATGARPFRGATASQLVDAILHRPAEVPPLGPGLPAAVEAVIRRCLEKPLQARYQSAAAIQADLSAIVQRLSRPFRRRPGPRAARSWPPASVWYWPWRERSRTSGPGRCTCSAIKTRSSSPRSRTRPVTRFSTASSARACPCSSSSRRSSASCRTSGYIIISGSWSSPLRRC
jgi:serine/threonine protein kinase